MKDIAKKPYIYEIEPTNHCPYKCIMCPLGLGKMTRPKGFMKLEVLSTLLSQFPGEQKLVRLHHFGEAVMHPEISTMLEMINDQDLIPILSLNPATLTPVLVEKIISGMKKGAVCFSLDSFSDQGLSKIRGIKRSFKDCWTMIEYFIDESRASGSMISKVIQMVCLELNIKDRDEFWKIKEKYPEPDVQLYLADNTGFGNLDLIEKTLPGGSKTTLKQAVACGSPFYEVSILWNGDVVLCCYDYDGFNIIGNVNEKSLEQIWQDKKIEDLRIVFNKRKTKTLPLCKGCFQAPHNFSIDTTMINKGLNEEKLILKMLAEMK